MATAVSTGVTTQTAAASAPVGTSLLCAPEGSAPTWVVPAMSSLSGGLFAIAVLWLGHYFTARRERNKTTADRQHARRSLLREKLELLLTLVDQEQDALRDHATHIASVGIHHSANQSGPHETLTNVGAYDRANAIVALYFPTLRQVMTDLDAARIAQMKFVDGELAAFARNAVVWRDGAAQDFGTRSAQALRGFIEARARLAREAREMIEGELAFQA